MAYKDLFSFYSAFVKMGLAQYNNNPILDCFISTSFGFPHVLVLRDSTSSSEKSLKFAVDLIDSSTDYSSLLLVPPDQNIEDVHKVCSNVGFTYSGFWEDMEIAAEQKPEQPAADPIGMKVWEFFDDEELLAKSILLVNRVLFPLNPLTPGSFVSLTHGDRFQWFSMTFNDEVVSTLLLYLPDDCNAAGIYMVCTEPDYRRKGCAQLLVNRALCSAFNKSYNKVILQSTPLGRKLYKGLGFKPTGYYGLFNYQGGHG